MSKLSSKTKSLLIIILVLILGAMVCPSIFMSKSNAYADGVEYNNYYFSNYHVDLEYDYENNVHVTERLTVVYGAPVNGLHKGIVRAIPGSTEISRGAVADDYKRTLGIKISNVSSNKLYDFYKEDGIYLIELGGDDYINEHSSVAEDYIISYTVKIGYDFTSDFDYVYYNVFGTDYPVAIKNATFSVTMPENIQNDMVYYVGEKGSDTAVTLTKQTLSDGKVKFEMTTPINLEAYEGVSVKTILKDGYFKGLAGTITRINAVNTTLVVVVIVAIIIITVVYISFKQKRKKCIETVEFYPPDGLNPAECCYLYNGQYKKMSSMFVYWASKGYLKIELDENKEPKGVRKLQNIPEHLSESEKVAFNKLFENTDYVDVTKHNEEIAKTFSASELMMKSSMGSRYSTASERCKVMTILFSVIIYAIVAFAECLLSNYYMWFFTYVVSLICIVAVGTLFGSSLSNFAELKIPEQWKKIFRNPFVMMCVGLPIPIIINICLSYMTVLWLSVRILVCVLLFVSISFKGFVNEYNDKWRDTIGKVRGFRNNILLVEADKLQRLVDNDPEYFYNVLPYAYAFGITEKFIKNFEHLTIPYNDNFGTIVDIAYFNMLNISLNTFARVPSSYSGGSIGGGGIGSGGGFGGGGSFGR